MRTELALLALLSVAAPAISFSEEDSLARSLSRLSKADFATAWSQVRYRQRVSRSTSEPAEEEELVTSGIIVSPRGVVLVSAIIFEPFNQVPHGVGIRFPASVNRAEAEIASARVRMVGGHEYPATFLGRDSGADVAFFQIDVEAAQGVHARRLRSRASGRGGRGSRRRQPPSRASRARGLGRAEPSSGGDGEAESGVRRRDRCLRPRRRTRRLARRRGAGLPRRPYRLPARDFLAQSPRHSHHDEGAAEGHRARLRPPGERSRRCERRYRGRDSRAARMARSRDAGAFQGAGFVHGASR